MPDWKAIQAKSKARKRTARSMEMVDWMAAIDYIMDEKPHLMEVPKDWRKHPDAIVGGTLKYCRDEAITTIVELAPRLAAVRYRTGPYSKRTTFVFPIRFVDEVLDFLGLDKSKYRTFWTADSVTRCQIGR